MTALCSAVWLVRQKCSQAGGCGSTSSTGPQTFLLMPSVWLSLPAGITDPLPRSASLPLLSISSAQKKAKQCGSSRFDLMWCGIAICHSGHLATYKWRKKASRSLKLEDFALWKEYDITNLASVSAGCCRGPSSRGVGGGFFVQPDKTKAKQQCLTGSKASTWDVLAIVVSWWRESWQVTRQVEPSAINNKETDWIKAGKAADICFWTRSWNVRMGCWHKWHKLQRKKVSKSDGACCFFSHISTISISKNGQSSLAPKTFFFVVVCLFIFNRAFRFS